MGVLSITPSLEWGAHGLLPARGAVRDPNPLVTGADGPRDGPRTSHFIWDITTGEPVFQFPEHERQQERGTVSRRYLDEQREQPTAFFYDRPVQQASSSSSSRPASQPVNQQRNAEVVKRKLGAMAKGMAKTRPRR